MKKILLSMSLMLTSAFANAGAGPLSQQQKINICNQISMYSKYNVSVKRCLEVGEFEAIDRVKNRYFTYAGAGLREDVTLVCNGRLNKISRVIIDSCSWE